MAEQTRRTSPASDTPSSGGRKAGFAAADRVRLLVGLSRAVLFWEDFWPRLAPAFGVLAIFAALSLFDVLPDLPGALHAVILATFALILIGALVWPLRRLSLPSERAAERRLETDSGLVHRPLVALDDRMANASDPVSEAIWEVHLRRARESLARLRLKPPVIPLSKREPLAPRAVIALLLVVAAAGAWGDMMPRFARALSPDFSGGTNGVPLTLDLWIVPPEYTREPPVFLHTGVVGATSPANGSATPANAVSPPTATDGESVVIAVPAGSQIRLQVQGGRGTPTATLGETEIPLEAGASGVHQADLPVGEGGLLNLTQRGRTFARWSLTVIPDRAPIIAFVDPPQRSERSALRLEYEARDDHGVASVRVEVTRQDGEAAGGPLVLDLPLSETDAVETSTASFHDLTGHIWAGLPVLLTPVAEDAIGQVGRGDPFEMMLPERIFNHPVARALVALRKDLSIDPSDRAPVIEGLDKLSRRPQHFFDDPVVYLAMRVALSRLLRDESEDAARSVQAILWDTALRLEDGEVSLAARELREIQRELQNALANDAPTEEIERLMNELQQAIDRYLEAMQRELAERGELTPEEIERLQEQMGNSDLTDRQSLQDMLDRAREMSRTGARDAAREMLEQLQRMLENLQAMPLEEMLRQQQQNQEAMRLLDDLDRLAQQQRELMDRTFRESQRGENGQQGQPGQPPQLGRRLPNLPPRPGPGMQDGSPQNPGEMGDGQEFGQGQQGQPGGGAPSAEEQEALRRQLGDIIRRLSELGGRPPDSLGRAGRSMDDATRALGENAPGEAVGPQGDALDQLQQGAQALADQMMQQFGPQVGQGPGQSRGQDNTQSGSRDPLGRERENGTGVSADPDVEIPEDWELQRSRDILNELRRRSGERFRPPVELDYLDRLLDRF